MNPYVFFGSDEFAVKVLSELKDQGYPPALILTTSGGLRRGRKEASPVEIWAAENQITSVLNLDPLKLKKFTFFLVASYGKILPASVLNLAAKGVLNIHPSLLPKYRGPSPLQATILNGDQETGVTIIQLDKKMDHGPIVASRKITLGTRNFIELRDDLAKLGADLFLKILPNYLTGKIELKTQDHSQATFTKKFTKAEAAIKLSDPAELNYRKVLALNPEPGTWLEDRGFRLKIKSARLEGGRFVPDRVVPAGRKEMDWSDYLQGQNR